MTAPDCTNSPVPTPVPLSAAELSDNAAREIAHGLMLDAARDIPEHVIRARLAAEYGESSVYCQQFDDLVERVEEFIAGADLTVEPKLVVIQTRLPGREAVTGQAAATSPDPAQAARRALLWNLATATPMPHPGMPNHEDIPAVDLARILSGLITTGLSEGWGHVVENADSLAAYLQAGGSANPTGQRYMENYLADAINNCAPDRGTE